jgi:hypothetical protein
MRVEDPLDTWPPTSPLDEDGFLVEAPHLTPDRARLVGILEKLASFAVLAAAVWVAFTEATVETTADFIWVGVTVLIVWVVATIIIRRLMRRRFSKTARIEVRPDVIRIGGSGGYKNYARDVPHTFELAIHDEAQDEAEHAQRTEEEYRRRGESFEVMKFYRESWHVILRYAGPRVDVATVYGKREAEALFARLQLLDEMMDAARGEIGGPNRPAPARQYGPRPETG